MKNVSIVMWMMLLCGSSLGAMDAGVIDSPLTAKIRQEVEMLELKALAQHQLFNGDKEKIKRVFHSLLALPAPDCQSSEREIDKELIYALASGNKTAAKQLLEKGANPNCYAPAGATMLLVALALGDPVVKYELVQELLEHGADPNLASAQCWTPLHAAVQQLQLGFESVPGEKGLMDTIKLLIQKGARMKLSLLDLLQGQDAVRSPLSYIEPHCAHNNELITLLMTTVYPEEVSPQAYDGEIVPEVVARNKLLLYISPLSMSLMQDIVSGDACKLLKKMLSVEEYDAQYRAQVVRNVRTMLAQAKKPK